MQEWLSMDPFTPLYFVYVDEMLVPCWWNIAPEAGRTPLASVAFEVSRAITKNRVLATIPFISFRLITFDFVSFACLFLPSKNKKLIRVYTTNAKSSPIFDRITLYIYLYYLCQFDLPDLLLVVWFLPSFDRSIDRSSQHGIRGS